LLTIFHQCLVCCLLTKESIFEISLASSDPIFAITAAFKADTHPKKINLGVGAYRDNNGKPWVLPVVKKAQVSVANDDELDHEYLPIDGLKSFTTASAKLILGDDSPAISSSRVHIL
jgi:aspartate aminotransferase, cytoplasmic